MPITKPLAASDLDPFSPEFRADPHAHYAVLRALGPVVWSTRHEIWMVTDHAHVRAVLSDHETFSSAGGVGLANYFEVEPWRRPSIILEVDPPEHGRTRAVLTRLFSPATIRAMRAEFEIQATILVDRALERGSIDAVAELARPYPLQVFSDAVGLAADGRETLLAYGAMVFGASGPRTEWREALMQRAAEISAWIDGRCRREALTPGGLGSAIYQAADRGEITQPEAALLVRSLLSAGIETTVDQIGLALRALVDHPDQWRRLRHDPSLARSAFEEATRFDGASQGLFRTTLRQTEFGGVTMGRHQKVLALIGSAARDPAQWEDPDRFDIGRRTTGHLGYGTGIHGCVAQMMARLEGEVLLQVMAHKLDRLEPQGAASPRLTPGLRGLTSLPVGLTRRG